MQACFQTCLGPVLDLLLDLIQISWFMGTALDNNVFEWRPFWVEGCRGPGYELLATSENSLDIHNGQEAPVDAECPKSFVEKLPANFCFFQSKTVSTVTRSSRDFDHAFFLRAGKPTGLLGIVALCCYLWRSDIIAPLWEPIALIRFRPILFHLHPRQNLGFS